MDVVLPVFQLLYFVAHFLVSLALSVIDTFHDLHRLLLRLCSFLAPTLIPACRLQADAAQLKKVPQHLGLILVAHQTHQISQLSTVISWAVAYGVRFVSLYDAHGILKRNKPVILKALEESNSDIMYNVLSYDQDCKPEKDTVAGKCVKTDTTTVHQEVTVNLLSQEDSRGNLASVAKRLSKTGCKITASTIESHLVTNGQPDPDVVITVGETFATFAFLPWQIRLAEFFVTSSLSRFEYSDFQTILKKYSRCEQRLGK
ncbi:dehydrodolichyl diphosphate synthase complex subunit NUS1 [Procambarus clarkii]|uniref:dehydrodolichyl diphosphate synthase complex subunit NUS1 n=1 Tax=Procambarus clarkii TaxID=6728 RepID=UPI001E6709AC|nr:dehydrodolichyl diphosphate synthase complex subunit NUS1-like [Procambarus clarkii]